MRKAVPFDPIYEVKSYLDLCDKLYDYPKIEPVPWPEEAIEAFKTIERYIETLRNTLKEIATADTSDWSKPVPALQKMAAEALEIPIK